MGTFCASPRSPSRPREAGLLQPASLLLRDTGSEWLSPSAKGGGRSCTACHREPSCRPAPPAAPRRLLPARVREGMVPSERARLRRPGSEEGEARRGDRNSCWLARGRKPGGVGMNRGGGEPATPEQGMARLGQVGKRPAESPGKYLWEPRAGGRGGSAWGAPRQPPPGCLSFLPRCTVGPESGSQRRRALVEAEKQFDHIHTIRTRWPGGVSETPPPHAPSDLPQPHSKRVPLQASVLK